MKKLLKAVMVSMLLAALVAGYTRAAPRLVYFDQSTGTFLSITNSYTNTNSVVVSQISVGWQSYTASATLAESDGLIYMDPYTNGQTLTLQSAATMTNRLIRIKNSGTNHMFVIDANGAELIDDQTTQTVSAAEAFTLHSDGAKWHIQ